MPLEVSPAATPFQKLLRNRNYLLVHLVCLGVIWVGWSWTAVWVAIGLYFLRMFAITAFYHRYLSHRTFTANRFWQFAFAVLGNSAAQRGPLWWAAHHRHHHQTADTESDVHSPSRHGFWWSHLGWLTQPANLATRWEYVKDWVKFPELVWLDRFDTPGTPRRRACWLARSRWMWRCARSRGKRGQPAGKHSPRDTIGEVTPNVVIPT